MPIYVPPSRFWKFYQKHEKDFESDMILVAESQVSKTKIYLTSGAGFPVLVVEVNGSQAETFLNEDQIRTYTQCLASLIPEDDSVFDESKYFDDEGCLSESDLDRLDLIQTATYEYLSTLFQDSPENLGIVSSDLEDIASRLEEILYDEYNISVLHPTVVETEEGAFVVQYPSDLIE